MPWFKSLATLAFLPLAMLVLDAGRASAQTAAQRRVRAIQARQQRNHYANNPVVINQFNLNVPQPFNPFFPNTNPFFIPPVNPFLVNNFVVAPVGRPVGVRPIGIRPVYNRDLNLVTYPGANPFLFNNAFNSPFFNPALNPFVGNTFIPAGFNMGNPFGLGAFGAAGFNNLPFGNFAGF
jgi:hypothetical protein